MKLKLDLHTHCSEATGFAKPTVEVVARIVTAIKARGLDGIAVTEHYDKACGYKIKEMVHQYFNDEVLIIPGVEIGRWSTEVVELYLPNDITFRFLVHPGYPSDFTNHVYDLHGIEIDNDLHNWHIDKQKVRAVAQKHGLLLLSNSDAHNLDDIGRFYNEISLEELCTRAQQDTESGQIPGGCQGRD